MTKIENLRKVLEKKTTIVKCYKNFESTDDLISQL
jgi:hypothetical protein